MFEMPWDSIDDDHIAGASQVVRLKLGHLVHVPARGLVNVLALDDVTHRERRSHNARARKGRFQHGCADHSGNAQLIHDV